MPHFIEVTENTLRAMAREASSLYLHPGGTSISPTDAVVKVASASRTPLTSEHVRRICEMTHHDIFERSFRNGDGPDRYVSFDPPDAEKVATAVRASRVESFSTKVASAPPAGGAMDKTASAGLSRPPPLRNAFSAVMARVPNDTTAMKKEAQHLLRSTREDLREAERALQVARSSASGSEKVAFVELLDDVVRASNQGVPLMAVVTACLEFAKSAGAPDSILEGVATDMIRGLVRRGCSLYGEKVAGVLAGYTLNDSHPLRAQAIKVAELRAYCEHSDLALRDVREQMQHVNAELRDARYQ